mmetsp:Transcript_16080/g.37283  ORF Transcript_16080/g.37283 Transcript_16080/m.37283 type:complete len:232 (-) Transcript_16080:1311-2006(-)
MEERFITVTITKYLRQRHSLSEVVDAVLIRENTKRDGVVIRSTVRANEVLLTIFIDVFGTIKELVQIVLLLLCFLVAVLALTATAAAAAAVVPVVVVVSSAVVVVIIVVIISVVVHLLVLRFVQVGAVSVVILAYILITWFEIQIDLVFAVITKTSITADHHFALIRITVDVVSFTIFIGVTIAITQIDEFTVFVDVSVDGLTILHLHLLIHHIVVRLSTDLPTIDPTIQV